MPAVVLLTACGSDSSTAPKASVPSADTVAIDQSTSVIIDHWTNASSSGYWDETAEYFGGPYVETYSSGTYSEDYRLLIPFSLPTLAGRGVVDSAKVFEYACYHYSNNSYNNPFTDSLVVDHVDGAAFQDSASWGGRTLEANIGTLVRDTTSGWKSVTVTSAVKGDYAAKRSLSQFRLEWMYSNMPANWTETEFAGLDCTNNAGGTSGDGYLVIWSH
ncbi:MAG TPA: hypothetical protein VNW46_12730 [Gemmatimonadaceae bacterium]|nr:hypothetical protein [Gemmatimonadaceae bacterium]